MDRQYIVQALTLAVLVCGVSLVFGAQLTRSGIEAMQVMRRTVVDAKGNPHIEEFRLQEEGKCYNKVDCGCPPNFLKSWCNEDNAAWPNMERQGNCEAADGVWCHTTLEAATATREEGGCYNKVDCGCPPNFIKSWCNEDNAAWPRIGSQDNCEAADGVWCHSTLGAATTTLSTTTITTTTSAWQLLGNGCCRTVSGNAGIYTERDGSDCRFVCTADPKCVGYEIESGGSPHCEIHTEELSHVDVVGLGCGIQQCWKKVGTKKCADGKYLTIDGQCLPECPPGSLKFVKGTDFRECSICDGQSRRRDSGMQHASKCTPCPDGHISKPNSDDCQNFQDTCDLDQCLACLECVSNVKPHIESCLNWYSEMSTAPLRCISEDTHWCPTLMRELHDCEGFSFGCYYKLMCHDIQICPEWKAKRCGGSETNALLQVNLPSASLLNRVARGQVSANNTQTGSLDNSLASKCTG